MRYFYMFLFIACAVGTIYSAYFLEKIYNLLKGKKDPSKDE